MIAAVRPAGKLPTPMNDEPVAKSYTFSEIAFGICVGFGILIANVFAALIADRFALLDEYLNASILLVPTVAIIVISWAKLGEAGATILVLFTLAIIVMNQMFVGYGEVG